jgi:REP element-mobilizing transposase RayT
MGIREKSHRLPREYYVGPVSVSFTLCIHKGAQAFVKPDIVTVFTDILVSVATKTECIIPAYCFMPDHQRVIIEGTHSDSDICKAITSYKQKSGFWMSKNKPEIRWQKDFYDHVIRKHEDLATQVKYILDNPVRKGLVSYWKDYAFKGSIGCKTEDVLEGLL